MTIQNIINKEAAGMHIETKNGREFIGRFQTGDDLLSAIENFCVKENIKLGAFQIIGAVKSAKMGYYDQDKQKYVESASLNRKLEIVSCIGNVSLKDGNIAIHAHIALADLDGTAFGGHLMPGTVIFAAEFFIRELSGGKLERKKDSATGLPLWQ
jgi:predicted DNA-binding protein with PD1-like motif